MTAVRVCSLTDLKDDVPTGRFDDEQLFYLTSRGIPAEQARRLVVRGFFGEILQKITVRQVRERLAAAIEAELEAVGG
jgi:Fe-S cluster assembly protein SufD